jgi:hypothetical protein
MNSVGADTPLSTLRKTSVTSVRPVTPEISFDRFRESVLDYGDKFTILSRQGLSTNAGRNGSIKAFTTWLHSSDHEVARLKRSPPGTITPISNRGAILNHPPCLQKTRLSSIGSNSPGLPLKVILIRAPLVASISTTHSEAIIDDPRSSRTNRKSDPLPTLALLSPVLGTRSRERFLFRHVSN